MPIVKKSEPMPARPVIILLFGEPGVCKTSLGNTANEPLLVDCDRGSDRSFDRPDTLVISSWEEVIQEETSGSFKGYKTVVLDTAKAALDDFLWSYVIRKDAKLRTNKLGTYGAIGDEFKLFVNNRRAEAADLVIICHSKEEKEGDILRRYPDVTGQSYQLLLRIADMVGFVSMASGKRNLSFDPTEKVVGKNVAALPPIDIPDKSSPDWKGFLGKIIEQTRAKISEQSEEQRIAIVRSGELQNELAETKDPATLTALLKKVKELPDYLAAPLAKEIAQFAKAQGWIVNKEAGRFEEAPSISAGELADRCKTLEASGAVMSEDGFNLGEAFHSYEDLSKMPEEAFKAFLAEVKPPAPPAADPGPGGEPGAQEDLFNQNLQNQVAGSPGVAKKGAAKKPTVNA